MQLRSAFVPMAIAIALTCSVDAQDVAALKERLHRAALLNALDTPEMKPWHLVMSFELLDPKGRAKDTGTLEEWWVSSTVYKVSYTKDLSTWTEVVNQEGLFKTTDIQGPPELATRLRGDFVHPIAAGLLIDDAIPTLEQTQLGNVAVDCIRLSPPPNAKLKSVPAAFYPVFCLDRDKTSLRITSRYGNAERLARMAMGKYGDKNVAIDEGVSFGGVLAAKAHLVKLQYEPLTAMDCASTSNMKRIGAPPVEATSGSTEGRILKKVPPTYPEMAKQEHASGTVLLHAIIGEDGHIVSLTPIYSPRFDLTSASIAAVKQWTYEPYIVNGQAYSVDTEITVNFWFNRM